MLKFLVDTSDLTYVNDQSFIGDIRLFKTLNSILAKSIQ